MFVAVAATVCGRRRGDVADVAWVRGCVTSHNRWK
jgi:hypothetical protein